MRLPEIRRARRIAVAVMPSKPAPVIAFETTETSPLRLTRMPFSSRPGIRWGTTRPLLDSVLRSTGKVSAAAAQMPSELVFSMTLSVMTKWRLSE